ncbi:MAG: UvrB/UvrC motif-containing protein, partial [Acidobacteriaceae bacterium]|nr:UvrB/UvrC motif-containing protein [Acidobacteriaceae bacterium]
MVGSVFRVISDSADELAPATILHVAVSFQFEQCVAFEPDRAAEILRSIPALPGVFALRGAQGGGAVEAQPYLTRAADLRRRIARMLAPAEISAEGVAVQSKRLNLRGRVAWIEYSVTGSEFESRLTLYRAAVAIYGLAEAKRRLRLHTPFFLRFTAENAFPRVYSTNRLSRRALANFYGPFPSRAAADRYCDAVLDLFKLRRCSEELAPYPEHPGCVYQEMKKCLAPCNQACTAEGAAVYSAEAAAVEAFFETRGESLLGDLTAQREDASAEMEFERAAQIHAQVLRVKAAAQLADEIVRPLPHLRAVIVQAAAEAEGDSAAAIFLVEGGALVGPARLSTLGVRAVKEQIEVGSSLFAQPLMLQA